MKIPIFGEKECFPNIPEIFNQKLAKSGQLSSESLFSGKRPHSKKMLKITFESNFNLIKICKKINH
jgi:hypothetical protein